MLGIFLYCGSSSLGQTASPGKAPVSTGSIEGKVTDRQGAPLAGATVVITNSQTKESVTVKTDASGGYQAERLAPGEYHVVISASGLITKTEVTRVKERRVAKVGARLKPVISGTSPPSRPS